MISHPTRSSSESKQPKKTHRRLNTPLNTCGAAGDALDLLALCAAFPFAITNHAGLVNRSTKNASTAPHYRRANLHLSCLSRAAWIILATLARLKGQWHTKIKTTPLQVDATVSDPSRLLVVSICCKSRSIHNE